MGGTWPITYLTFLKITKEIIIRSIIEITIMYSLISIKITEQKRNFKIIINKLMSTKLTLSYWDLLTICGSSDLSKLNLI
jgi:hypothetical protein